MLARLIKVMSVRMAKKLRITKKVFFICNLLCKNKKVVIYITARITFNYEFQ